MWLRRIAIFTAIVALASTACTALVLGKLSGGDFDGDGGTDNSSSGSPGSTNDAAANPCSLLAVEFENPVPDNACADCITNSCSDEVTYACNGGGQSEKNWFGKLTQCAQHPYAHFAPPEAGSTEDEWGCDGYQDAQAPVNDPGTDNQHLVDSQRCVAQKCMVGKLPACRQCVVRTTRGATQDIAYLNQDECGKCFTDNCMDTVVSCCDSPVVTGVLSKCAYTKQPDNLTACQHFNADDAADASDQNSFTEQYGGEAFNCLAGLTACYKNFCNDQKYACNPSH